MGIEVEGMLSYKTALLLKKAGLAWEPEIGDLYYYDGGKIYDCYSTSDRVATGPNPREWIDIWGWVFAPSLSYMFKVLGEEGVTYTIDGPNWPDETSGDCFYCEFTYKGQKIEAIDSIFLEAVAKGLLEVLNIKNGVKANSIVLRMKRNRI